MELRQMSVIQSFISEDPIDGEKFARSEWLLVSYHFEIS